jgi:murein DD-endopeptidase MepM/ murein hydrolase activator NlpD
MRSYIYIYPLIYIAGRGVTSVYAHLHIRERIKLGMLVQEGELIGWIGRMLRDPHLHLEIWMEGSAMTAKTPTALAHLICGALDADC